MLARCIGLLTRGMGPVLRNVCRGPVWQMLFGSRHLSTSKLQQEASLDAHQEGFCDKVLLLPAGVRFTMNRHD